MAGLSLIADMHEDEYHSLQLTSASLLKTMWSKTPAHVYHQYFSGEEKKLNQNFVIGNMLHAAILEPHEFDNRFSVVPEGLDRRTKVGKELFADIEASGKAPIKAAEWKDCQKMASSIKNLAFFRQNPTSKALKEVVLLDDHRKCRADLVYANGDVVYCVDLKTAADASELGFQRAAYKLGYHIQSAWYTDILAEYFRRPVVFMFAVVEKSEPYLAAMYGATEEFLTKGREDYKAALKKFEYCLAADQWGGYPTETQELSLPDWVTDEINDIEI